METDHLAQDGPGRSGCPLGRNIEVLALPTPDTHSKYQTCLRNTFLYINCSFILTEKIRHCQQALYQLMSTTRSFSFSPESSLGQNLPDIHPFSQHSESFPSSLLGSWNIVYFIALYKPTRGETVHVVSLPSVGVKIILEDRVSTSEKNRNLCSCCFQLTQIAMCVCSHRQLVLFDQGWPHRLMFLIT